MRRLIATGLAALLLASCGQGDSGNDAADAGEAETNLSTQAGVPSQDLAAVVGGTPRLARLIQAAGMEKVLSGREPYTLLAPTDAALDKLPAGSLDNLDQPEQKARVTALLRAHILPGTILAADLTRAVESGGGKATIATMAGERLTIASDGGAFRISNAAGQSAGITGTEQPARNGVVHAIDTVLAPAG